VLDPDETAGGAFDRGWLPYLTIYSRELNVDAEGNPRGNINDSDLQKLHTDLTNALSEDLANFIIAYRTSSSTSGGSSTGGASSGKGGSGGGSQDSSGSGGRPSDGGSQGGGSQKNGSQGGGANGGSGKSGNSNDKNQGSGSGQSGVGSGGSQSKGGSKISKDSLDFKNSKPRSISSLFELINTEVEMAGSSPDSPKVKYPSPLNDAATRRELLPVLLDKFSTSRSPESSGLININTAPSAVLAGLPGLD
jgi:hypothetical protein